jgi:hypothetical protein
MRRIAVAVLLAAAPVSLAGCVFGGDDEKKQGSGAVPTSVNGKGAVYFGWLQGSKEPAGVAIWAQAGLGKAGKLSIYACDGLGPPQGMAVWFGGAVDPDAIQQKPVQLTSSTKREKLDIDTYNERLVKGTFTAADGERHQYVAYPSRDGAGIYEVSLDKNLKYTGTSTLGDTVTAQAASSGSVEGTVKTAYGDDIPFKLHTLSFATPAQLAAKGLSTTYRKDVKQSNVPGEYVAVIAPSSTHWLGRIGTIQTFRTGTALSRPGGGVPLTADIIGLDKKEFTATP